MRPNPVLVAQRLAASRGWSTEKARKINRSGNAGHLRCRKMHKRRMERATALFCTPAGNLLLFMEKLQLENWEKARCQQAGKSGKSPGKKERCSVTNIGDKLELTVEVMQQKGSAETTNTYTLKLPHDLDGIIINLPAYVVGLPEEAYLEEFIPAPSTDVQDEEPLAPDDMGMDEM